MNQSCHRFAIPTWLFAGSVLLILGYMSSIGPAIWLVDRVGAGRVFVVRAYRPILWLRWRSPTVVAEAYESYMDYWSDDERVWVLADHTRWEIGLDP